MESKFVVICLMVMVSYVTSQTSEEVELRKFEIKTCSIAFLNICVEIIPTPSNDRNQIIYFLTAFWKSKF